MTKLAMISAVTNFKFRTRFCNSKKGICENILNISIAIHIATKVSKMLDIPGKLVPISMPSIIAEK